MRAASILAHGGANDVVLGTMNAMLRLLVVVVGISIPRLTDAVPSVPTGPNAAAKQLQITVTDAIAAGTHHLAIPAQDTPFVFSNSSLTFTNARDLVVNFTGGVEFWFYLGFGVEIVDCHNVTFLGGLTIDADPPNLAQGVVVEAPTAGAPNVFVARFDERFIPPGGGPFVRPGGLVGAKVAFWNPSDRRMRPSTRFCRLNAQIERAAHWTALRPGSSFLC